MITINNLKEWRKLINLRELARLSNIPFARLYAKVNRGSALTTDESAAIENALSKLSLRKDG